MQTRGEGYSIGRNVKEQGMGEEGIDPEGRRRRRME
jgi:hypothetical protein